MRLQPRSLPAYTRKPTHPHMRWLRSQLQVGNCQNHTIHVHRKWLPNPGRGEVRAGQRTKAVRCGAMTLPRETTRAQNDIGAKKTQPPKRMCTRRTGCKETNAAYPKWRPRSSVLIAASVESSISMSAELEACGTERGRHETCVAVWVWELESRGG